MLKSTVELMSYLGLLQQCNLLPLKRFQYIVNLRSTLWWSVKVFNLFKDIGTI